MEMLHFSPHPRKNYTDPINPSISRNNSDKVEVIGK
ncbi:unnamed protein product, partial [Didymodactylos carnosus]